MKALCVATLLAAALFVSVQALPGARRDSAESSESEERKEGAVPLLHPLKGLFDDYADGSSAGSSDEQPPSIWHPFRFSFEGNPFEAFVSKMQETMNRIRAQMAATLSGQPGQGHGLMPWGKAPEGANTTSTTKIIGDHKVTINETTYSDGNEDSGIIYRVRVIDVKPLSEPTVGPQSSVDDASLPSAEEVQTTTDADKKEAATTASPQSAADREEVTSQAPSRDASAAPLQELDNEIPKSKGEALAA